MVYEPREDSYFLAGFVQSHARGRVLDMCAGTGVQAKAALLNDSVTSVLAVDIDPAAVVRMREELMVFPHADTKESDLFTAIEGETFDTIVCNPPYLPQEEQDEDPALYGGKDGYEFTVRFLEHAKRHLADDGHILLLFSSLTSKERVDRAVFAHGYRHEQLGELAMFFERLYVYRIWRHDG